MPRITVVLFSPIAASFAPSAPAAEENSLIDIPCRTFDEAVYYLVTLTGRVKNYLEFVVCHMKRDAYKRARSGPSGHSPFFDRGEGSMAVLVLWCTGLISEVQLESGHSNIDATRCTMSLCA